jgi:hypothetical protein
MLGLKLNPMNYTCSLDNLAKGVTIGVAILFIVIISFQFLPLENTNYIGSIFISILPLSIFMGVYAFHPVKYMLTESTFIIHRPLSDVNIKKEMLVSAQIVDKASMKWTIRTFGVGGLFGYFGKFTNRTLGSMTFYATRRSNYVLIITSDGRKIIITPDEPNLFVEKFNSLFTIHTSEFSKDNPINTEG